MAKHVPTTRATRYVSATRPITVELHQPVAPGEVHIIAGHVLGAMHVDGQVHHYRVVDGDGALLLVPPEWVKSMGDKISGATCPTKPMRAEVLA